MELATIFYPAGSNSSQSQCTECPVELKVLSKQDYINGAAITVIIMMSLVVAIFASKFISKVASEKVKDFLRVVVLMSGIFLIWFSLVMMAIQRN